MPIFAPPAPAGQLGYAQITSTVTNTGGTAYATGLGVSVTIPASGRNVKVTVYSVLFNSTAATTPLLTLWTGAAIGTLTTQLQQWNGVTSPIQDGATLEFVDVAPAAGTKTYSVATSINSGTGTVSLTAGATLPAFILVEGL